MKKTIMALVLMVSIMFAAVAAEAQETHEQHKEQKICRVNIVGAFKDVKIPEGWHVVCITVDRDNYVIYVLEKN